MTKIEQTILMNQYKILAKLDLDNSSEHEANAEILEQGLKGLFSRVLISGDGISEEVCEETHEILTMFRVIDNGVAAIGSEKAANLDLEKIKFAGFDANNDSHYFFADYLINKQNLYSELKGKYLNSHSQSAMMLYSKMLSIHRNFKKDGIYQYGFKELQHFIESI